MNKIIQILILSLFLYVTQQMVFAKNQEQEDLSHYSDPAQVFLHKFYTEYAINSNYSKAEILRRQNLTREFLYRRYDDPSFEDGELYFDADPILCTQDYDEELLDGLRVVVLIKDQIYKVCDAVGCRKFTIVKKNDKYLIDDIKCHDFLLNENELKKRYPNIYTKK